MYYLNSRMYDPTTARFLQEDTYSGNSNDPLSLNLYTYCHNEPIMYWDPTGHNDIENVERLLNDIIEYKEIWSIHETIKKKSIFVIQGGIGYLSTPIVVYTPQYFKSKIEQFFVHGKANEAREEIKQSDLYKNNDRFQVEYDNYLKKDWGGTFEDVEYLIGFLESLKPTPTPTPTSIPTVTQGTVNQILTPSQQIIDFIKDYEDFSLTLYDASVGIGKPPSSNPDWTIGWGHKVYANSAEFKEFQNGITKDKAQELFDKDLNKMLNTTFVPMLKKNNIYLTQGQFDAMLDFTYQFGEYSWSENDKEARTTMRDFIIKGDYSAGATKNAFSMYMGRNAAQGTIARMNDRYEIFMGLEKDKYIREYNYSQLM